MNQTRIEMPFRCGFDPSHQSYAAYVSHIRECTHRDCDRRYANHLLIQTYFARKYGDGKLDANEHPAPSQDLASPSIPMAQPKARSRP